MRQNIRLIQKRQVANGTMAFYFEKPAELEFRAGQFCNITLINPPETDEEGNTRGFSLITAPCEEDMAVATRLRDTAFKRVIKQLEIGTEVRFEGPYGNFTLHKAETVPAVFLIGGIGVTPVRSMIVQAIHDNTRHRIILLHANPSPSYAPFMVDFEQLAKNNQHFTFVPVATEGAPDDWYGEQGRINEAMVKKYVPDLNLPIYYLSGPGSMVMAMRQLLVNMGINEDKIRTEEFTGY